MYAFRLAVRQNTRTGMCVAGPANSLPHLSADWRDIKSFGRWTGRQTNYQPYRTALRNVVIYASYVNSLASGL